VSFNNRQGFFLTSVIELKDVVVSYQDIRALDGVTLSFDKGATGLLGPNGAGKSTLIKTLLGFIRAEKGDMRLFGMEMPRQAIEIRHRLGYMPEREISSPKVSAVSFLTYCGRIFGMSRVDALERAHEVLNYVKLGDSRYRNMETYSTGMLQRVKLAQAILHDPKLLLLDEPTNGLDPDGRIEVLNLVKEIAVRPGVSVILSSHLLPDVQHVCSRVVMIDKGRVVQSGDIQTLTPRHADHFEVRFRNNDDLCIATMRAEGHHCIRLHPANTWLIQCSGTDGMKNIFEVAARCGAQVRHFQPARYSLESVFLQAVGKE
jgi:ABC-2 type transport system ATP-binding protein